MNREIWQKALKSDPDQMSDEKDGDLQVTLEQGNREIKAYSEGSSNWLPIYSETEVKEWIAAGSQFQGTVQNAGHGTAGAIDMSILLPQSSLAVGDKSTTGYGLVILDMILQQMLLVVQYLILMVLYCQ